MERCQTFNECRKHYAERGVDKLISNGKASIEVRFMCTVCERRWTDQYKYQYTVDRSFTEEKRDPSYGDTISDSVTSE